MADLADSHAVVTGGYTGIGAAIAERLTALGARVSVMARSGDKARAFAETLSAARGFACDVTDGEQVAAAFEAAVAAHGPVDILVANAGSAAAAPFAEMSEAEFRRSLDVNLMGVFHTAQAVLPAMTAAGRGRIVVVASTAGLKPYANVSAYVAAKHGAVGLVRALALETARTGVTVNAVCPGYTETDMARQAIDGLMDSRGLSEEEARAKLARTNPMRRLVEPAEVANAVEWLVKPGSEAITGQAVAVAGGEVM